MLNNKFVKMNEIESSSVDLGVPVVTDYVVVSSCVTYIFGVWWRISSK
jgi:hypothetical protein